MPSPIRETNRNLRGHAFLPPQNELKRLPGLRKQEKTPAPDKIAYLHYFGGPFDLWVVEGAPDLDDPENPDFEFFGYVRYAHMPDGAEWGRQSACYLEQQVFRPSGGFPFLIERDCYWDPQPMWACDRADLYNRHGYTYVDMFYRNSSQARRAEMCRKAHTDGASSDAAMWRVGRWWTVDTAPPAWRRYFGLDPLPDYKTGYAWKDQTPPRTRG